MGFLYLFIAILGESGTTIIEKLNFRRNKITAQYLMFLLFLAMSVLLSLFVLITKQPFPHFTLVSLGLIGLIVAVSFSSNIFDVLSLKADDLSLREPLSDFAPIVAGLIGYALFPAERKPGYLLAFLLGGVIVYWGTHRRKLRKFQKKGLFYLLLAICLEALLVSIYKVSLDYLSPVYITLFRVVAILILSSVFFPVKNVRKLTSKKLGYGLLAGLVCTIGAVASLYAIHALGVVLTMLLSMFGPFLRYSAGYFVLKENVRKGELLSSALLATVVLVPILR